MAVTTSWGYTNGTTQVATNLKMAKLSATDYAEVMRDSNTNEKTVAQYRNLTTPANMGEYVQLRAERRNNISKSYKTAFPPETKNGYMFSIKMEDTLRKTDEQGVQTDNPVSMTLTCQATDGTYASGGITSGADWLVLFQRFMGFMLQGVYDISDSEITIDQSTQNVFDKLMHTVAELQTTVSEQA